TQYVLQLHLQNTGDVAVTEHSSVTLSYADDATQVTPAGLFALGSFSFSIPAGASDYQATVDCQATREMHVFAAFPHMHKLGRAIELRGGPTADSESLLYGLQDYTFLEQKMDPVDFTIAPGEFLRSTCHWDNPGTAPVSFGESSDQEMCFMVVFYYPFD